MSTHTQVKEFMQVMDQDTPAVPCIPPYPILLLRCKLMLEECIETIRAAGFIVVSNQAELIPNKLELVEVYEPNIVDFVDGLCDSEYVGFAGSAAAFGLSEECMAECFAEVHRSNMSKLWTCFELFYLGVRADLIDGANLGYTIKFDVKGKTPSNIIDVYTCICKFGNGEPVGRDINKIDRMWIVKDIYGKIIKSPSYSPANLEPILIRHGYKSDMESESSKG